MILYLTCFCFSINITEEIGHQENTCDLTIKGHYKVETSSPLIERLLGGTSIRGDGNAKVKMGTYCFYITIYSY